MLHQLVNSAYQLQKTRVETGNRLVSNFKIKLGIEPGTKEDSDKKAADILTELREEYNRVTDGYIDKKRTFTFESDGLISNMAELTLVDSYMKIEASESRHFKQIGKELENYRVWTEFLKDVKGVGPAMAGVLITSFNPHKGKYVSSFWKYAGLDVVNGEGRKMKREHLEKRTYVDANGEEKEKNSITYNPDLKSKLYILATSMMRSGSEYREVYDNYKHRLNNSPRHQDKTDAHKHAMALRYMIKIFLIDFYKKAREVEGLPVHDPYHESKLGMNHGDHIG